MPSLSLICKKGKEQLFTDPANASCTPAACQALREGRQASLLSANLS